MSAPEWNDFRVILALGRAGSVAGAARILDIDGSTVSRRLAAVEQAMGAVLIVRGGREFAFTAAGRAALAAAEAMESAVSDAAAAVRHAGTDLQGIVRIACPPVGIAFLSGFQDRVSQKYPGLGVELLSGRAPVDLARGEADIAIRAVRPSDIDLVVARTFDLGTCVYAATSYLSAHGHPSTLAEVSGHKLVRYANAFLHLAPFNWIEQFADPAVPAVRVDSIDMARSMIAAGDGIGVLYCVVGDATKGVVRVFEEPIDQLPFSIVYHESLRGSARLRAVLDLLIAYHMEGRNILSGRRSET
jgi:DNA-binding transcriptional LysR family regulator